MGEHVSIVAEFARELHESFPAKNDRPLCPLPYPSKSERLADIRVVVFDIYGTLFNYWRPEFEHEEVKKAALLSAFEKTVTRFGMREYLLQMDPREPAEKTLSDLYHGLITLKHGLAAERSIEFPEIKIESVWQAVVLMLKRRGYNPACFNLGDENDFVKCIAYYYNFVSFARSLYPGVYDALTRLQSGNIRLGAVSNAQFYTLIDLSLFLRDQSSGGCDDYIRLFDPNLMFFSFEYGVAKPHELLFRKLFDALYEYHVLPSQALFVGNDIAADIRPAQQAGMKTAFFNGDDRSAFVHDLAGKVVPDIIFSQWHELADKISFYSGAVDGMEKGA
jgi:putative hydrolase of the HAD superfamily